MDALQRPMYSLYYNKRCNAYYAKKQSFEDAEEDCNKVACSFIMSYDCRNSDEYHVCPTGVDVIDSSSIHSCVYQKGKSNYENSLNRFWGKY